MDYEYTVTNSFTLKLDGPAKAKFFKVGDRITDPIVIEAVLAKYKRNVARHAPVAAVSNPVPPV